MRYLLVLTALCAVLCAPAATGVLAQETKAKKAPPVVPSRLKLAEGATYAYRFTEKVQSEIETETPSRKSSNDRKATVICDVRFTVAKVHGDGACDLDVTVTRVQGTYDSSSDGKKTYDEQKKSRKPGVSLISQIGHVSRVTVAATGAILSVEGAADALAINPEDGDGDKRAFFDRFLMTLPDEPLKRTGKWSAARYAGAEFMYGAQHVHGKIKEDYRVTKLTHDAATVTISAKGKHKSAKGRKKGRRPSGSGKRIEAHSVKGTAEIDPATGLCRVRKTESKFTTLMWIGAGYNVLIDGTYEYETRLEAVDPTPDDE